MFLFQGCVFIFQILVTSLLAVRTVLLYASLTEATGLVFISPPHQTSGSSPVNNSLVAKGHLIFVSLHFSSLHRFALGAFFIDFLELRSDGLCTCTEVSGLSSHTVCFRHSALPSPRILAGSGCAACSFLFPQLHPSRICRIVMPSRTTSI